MRAICRLDHILTSARRRLLLIELSRRSGRSTTAAGQVNRIAKRIVMPACRAGYLGECKGAINGSSSPPATDRRSSIVAGRTGRRGRKAALLPTQDVDVSYDVALPSQPRIRERMRWLAAEQLERVDGPDKSTTIFDRRTHEITLLTPANRTFRQLDMPRQPEEPAPEATLKRGNELSLRDCTALTGRGPKTWKRALCASPRTACCFAFSSTPRRLPRRVR